jgi:hypothetical protein
MPVPIFVFSSLMLTFSCWIYRSVAELKSIEKFAVGNYKLNFSWILKDTLYTVHVNSSGLNHSHTAINLSCLSLNFDRFCGLVVRVPGYISRGPEFDSRRYQIFWEIVGLEWCPLSLVSITEELFQIIAAPEKKTRLMAVGIRSAEHATPFILKGRH